MNQITNRLTYREIAVNRLISIGISNRWEAEEIVRLIDINGEFATSVFRDFKSSDNWDTIAELEGRKSNE